MTERDPRKLPGSVAGPGGPHDRNGVVIDATNAVLMDSVVVALVEPFRDGNAGTPLWTLNLGGRINKSRDRAEIVCMFDVDGAAAIVTELLALAARQGPDVHEGLMARIEERMEQLGKDGTL